MKKIPYAKQLIAWRKRREKAQALYSSGVSLTEIGKRLGCSKQRVHQLVNNHAKVA
jgi:DNA-directed RNA polymerase specialized sigma subunit